MCIAMENEKIRSGEETTLILMLNLMNSTGWDAEVAMEKLGIPIAERPLYARSAVYAMSRQKARVSATK